MCTLCGLSLTSWRHLLSERQIQLWIDVVGLLWLDVFLSVGIYVVVWVAG